MWHENHLFLEPRLFCTQGGEKWMQIFSLAMKPATKLSEPTN